MVAAVFAGAVVAVKTTDQDYSNPIEPVFTNQARIAIEVHLSVSLHNLPSPPVSILVSLLWSQLNI